MANRWSTGPLPRPMPRARPSCKACQTKAFARPTASRSPTPCASRAVMAAESVQPVPCVLRVSTFGRTKRSMPVASHRMSTASSPLPCPPLRSTAWHPSARSAWACAATSASLVASLASSRRAASGRLGVIRRACGNSSRFSASTASASSRTSPLVATITGSTTSGRRGPSRSRRATASTMPALASIPVLMAPTARSHSTASICATTKEAATGSTAATPCVFCAVSAVMTEAP